MRLQRPWELAGVEESGLSDRWENRVKASFTYRALRSGALTAMALLPLSAAAAGPAFDARSYPGPTWSPYLVGAGIGVLSWLTFYYSDKPIGASSFYATLAGLIGKLFAPKHTEQLAYFKTEPPTVNWGFIFLLATIAGALISALTGGEFANEWVPQMWHARFGDSIALRGFVAFAGGVLMAFGARLAGGCTSGHGISGTMQLNVASWIAVVCFFIGGIAVAMLLFRV